MYALFYCVNVIGLVHVVVCNDVITCSSQSAVGPGWHETKGLRESGRVIWTMAIRWLRCTAAFCLLSTASRRRYTREY